MDIPAPATYYFVVRSERRETVESGGDRNEQSNTLTVRVNRETIAWLERFRADRQTRSQAVRYLLAIARQWVESGR